MSDIETEVHDLARALVSLLADPHPGLATWQRAKNRGAAALYKKLRELAAHDIWSLASSVSVTKGETMKSSVGTPHVVQARVEFEMSELFHINKNDPTLVPFKVEVTLEQLKAKALELLRQNAETINVAEGITISRIKEKTKEGK